MFKNKEERIKMQQEEEKLIEEEKAERKEKELAEQLERHQKRLNDYRESLSVKTENNVICIETPNVEYKEFALNYLIARNYICVQNSLCGTQYNIYFQLTFVKENLKDKFIV